MDEKNRNSMKLDIEAVRLSENDRDPPTESYKQISENSANSKSPTAAQLSTTNMTRDKNEIVEDGADEKMLSADEKEQLAQKDEVKFIPANDRSNGDAKIEIGRIDKAFTGMTKEELMKYANDPFWIRLRWTFFILFWLLWVAMLGAAILIVMKAPKCSGPIALPWYKEGPLVKVNEIDARNIVAINAADKLSQLQSINTKGVIYELPMDKTYLVDTAEVRTFVQDLVGALKNSTIQLILDLTPNLVPTDDVFYKEAIINETYHNSLIWLSSTPTESDSWKEVKAGQFVFTQPGQTFINLQLDDVHAKNRFKDVLRSYIALGVKGFRLANAKHFIINRNVPEAANEYDQWKRNGTAFQPGLGDLLKEFWHVVNNGTNGEGFLSLSDNIDNIASYKTVNGTIGFDLPLLYALPQSDGGNVAEELFKQLNTTVPTFGRTAWIQWPYNKTALSANGISSSEYILFQFLLPGVPVGTLDELVNNKDEIQKLEEIRSTLSYQHGNFDVYLQHNKTVVAYSRLKTGNPGYFVAYNPTADSATVDFSNITQLPEHLTVVRTSNVHGDKSTKVPVDAVHLEPHSTIILTYAPKTA